MLLSCVVAGAPNISSEAPGPKIEWLFFYKINIMPKGVYKRISLEERMLSHISKDETTGCWVWTGRLDQDGYGQTSDKERTVTAHRAMFEIKNGPITAGMVCGHTCDDKYPKDCKLYRKCCNPDHIRLMTNQENLDRMVELGRSHATAASFKPGQTSGENNIKAKLTGAKVIEIRTKAATAGYGDLNTLATEYGIQYQTLYKIIKGALWNKPEYYPTS